VTGNEWYWVTAGNTTIPLTALHIDALSSKIKSISSTAKCMTYELYNGYGYAWINEPCSNNVSYNVICELSGQGLSPTGMYLFFFYLKFTA
jgi:hypothetical protein